MKDFVHLHIHSHYSLLRALPKIKELVKTAKKRGFSAVSLTDYGSMYGAIEFYQACKKEELKPIIGFVAYLAPRGMKDLDPKIDTQVSELVLLAKNYEGYKNLMKLSSIGHLEGFLNGKPRIDIETLKQYSKHVIGLCGGINGKIGQQIINERREEAKETAVMLKEVFAPGDFYLELQDHPAMEGQLLVNNTLIDLSKELKIPLVATRDVHYLHPSEADAQDILRCIGEGWKSMYSDREDFRHVDRSLNSGEEMASRFHHVPEALENTKKIADQIDIEIELDNWHFAPVEHRDGKDYNEMLREDTYAAAPKFYPDMGKEITDRIDYELDIIKTKGYSPYFLCVADYVRYAKSQGIVESTRGSAAGSLVSYVLGITTVDPIRFKLPFERFLNPMRPSPPDVDTDFADNRRHEVIEYVTEKYGFEKVANIITFGTMAARAAVRDVGRVLGLSYNFCDQVAKLIPQGAQGFPMTIERALKEEPDLKKLYDTNEEAKELIDLAQQVEGCARHTSIHAAGVVISPTPLTDFTPVQRETGGEKLVTQYDMHAVEAAGVLKNDFLGIRNLTILGTCVEIVQATLNKDVDIYNLPLDDKKTFDMLAEGHTMGVFQFASSGMTRWLKELKPTNIDDLMAMVALYRPGPMDFIPEYIRRKHHPEFIDYPHPDLKDTLEKSLGLLIYQDDVMLTAIKLAGYDWLEADKFRKAMGKKIPELMVEQEGKFKKGCIANNITKQTANDLWDRIKPFATYAFNKAHAASYGIVAYQTAYMKANYPVQYMTAVLQAESGDNEKVAQIVAECRAMNIAVKPPDVNESFRSFAMTSKAGEPGRIRFGLSAVKNVGEGIAEAIYLERKKNGLYTDLENFLERNQNKDMNKRSLENLTKAGALDCFGIDRGVLIENLENMLFFHKQYKEKQVSNQPSLFSGTDLAFDAKVVIKESEPASMQQKLIWEKELLGVYISSHPYSLFAHELDTVVTKIVDTENHERDSWIVVAGVLSYTRKLITKKGDPMMFATVEDNTGSVELLIFPKTYAKSKEIWQVGDVVCIVGKTTKDIVDNKIIVENVYPVTYETVAQVVGRIALGNSPKSKKGPTQTSSQSSSSTTVIKKDPGVYIQLSAPQAMSLSGQLKEVFEQYPGEKQLYLIVGRNTIKAENTVNTSEAFLKAIGKIDETIRVVEYE